jgi:hypothetical protein
VAAVRTGLMSVVKRLSGRLADCADRFLVEEMLSAELERVCMEFGASGDRETAGQDVSGVARRGPGRPRKGVKVR